MRSQNASKRQRSPRAQVSGSKPASKPAPRPSEPSDLLSANLLALEDVAPELAERLRRPVDSSHIIIAADGKVYYKQGLTELQVSMPRVELSQPDDKPATDPVFLFGLGAGEILEHALKAFPGRPIFAWDRDPSMLRLALSRVALADPIRAGQVQLLLGSDL